MTTQNKPQGDSLREAAEKVCRAWEADPTDPTAFGSAMDKAVADLQSALSQPPAPEQASGEHWCTYCNGENAHNCQFNTNLPRTHVYATSHTVSTAAPVADVDTLRQCANPDSAAPVAAKPIVLHGELHGHPAKATFPAWPEQQAQAGEPEVVRWGMTDGKGRVIDCIGPIEKEHGAPQYTEPLITLQSHREAITKRDAALQACVEALHSIDQQIDLSKYPSAPPDVTLLDELRAAIQQAEEARK